MIRPKMSLPVLLFAAVGVIVIVLTVIGCGSTNSPATDSESGVELDSGESAPDCDLEDQRNRDSDCGYYRDGRWVWWSWVKQGQVSKPRPGWSAARERGLRTGQQPAVTTQRPRQPQSGTNTVRPAQPQQQRQNPQPARPPRRK